MLKKITKNHWIAFGLLAMLFPPLIAFQPAGAAAAGLVDGFMLPLERVLHVAFFLSAGIVAVMLGRQALMALPAALALMLVIGAASDVAMLGLPFSQTVMFASVLLYALAVSVGYSKHFLPVAAAMSAVSFYLGAGYIANLPDLASLEYFLFGIVGSAALLMACGASLSIAGLGYWAKMGEKLKKVPAMASFLSLF